MKDTLGREITYLRISLTDLCNLRCAYCMPPEGAKKLEHRDILSFEEIGEIARAAVSLPTPRRAVYGPCLRLTVEGLRGGHSGV